MDPRTIPLTKLYRDCLRLADYVGTLQGNRGTLLNMVRSQFRKHAGETDEEKIVGFKEDAMRAMGNYALMEANRIQEEQRKLEKVNKSTRPTTNLDGRIDPS